MWSYLLSSTNLYYKNELGETSQYCKLLRQEVREKTIVQINKDIDRTMPLLRFFRSEQQLRALFRILYAYAAYNTQIDYCQGMGFTAAIFLYYLPERQAYWVFYRFMQLHGELFD